MKLSNGSQILITLILIIGGIFAAIYYVFAPTTVQSKANPNNSHKAILSRSIGIDVNFKIVVDGERVYFSPDFAPAPYDFREQIAWDKTGNILVLEVGGKRLFAYDAEQKRKLSDSELLAVEYVPFFEYQFEGRLPQVTNR
jgi:hypothetical protein